MEVKIQPFQKGALIDLFHHEIARLRRRVNSSAHDPIFALLEKSEDLVVNKADELCGFYDWMEGYIPFIFVLPEESLGFSERVALVRDQTDTRSGISVLDPKDISDAQLPLSRSDPYVLMGVFPWRDPRVATTPEEARKVISIKGRSCLGMNETIALASSGFMYGYSRQQVRCVICVLGSVYSPRKHSFLNELEVPAFYVDFEDPEGPRLAACSPRAAPGGSVIYMPFCIERLTLTP